MTISGMELLSEQGLVGRNYTRQKISLSLFFFVSLYLSLYLSLFLLQREFWRGWLASSWEISSDNELEMVAVRRVGAVVKNFSLLLQGPLKQAHQILRRRRQVLLTQTPVRIQRMNGSGSSSHTEELPASCMTATNRTMNGREEKTKQGAISFEVFFTNDNISMQTPRPYYAQYTPWPINLALFFTPFFKHKKYASVVSKWTLAWIQYAYNWLERRKGYR